MEFAVSKKDFHIIRTRRQGDDAVDMVFEPPKAPPPAPSALAFTTPSSGVSVGACTGPVGVETREPSGARKVLADPVTINWAAIPPSAVFFSDAKCTTALTGTRIDAKASSAEIYFRASQVGPLQITVSATGLTGASQTYSVEPARAMALAFTTPPQTVAKGTCSSAITLQAKDAFDNPASVAAETPIQLVAKPTGGVSFYAHPDCTGTAATAASIPANGNSTSFYLKGRRAGTVAISATLAAGSASQDAVITSDRPQQPSPPGKAQH
jgi:hypothetical protein